MNQKLALRLLSRMGYQADVAANGVEAIDAVERQPYDLVLMDVQMPEMDGLEATRHIVDHVEVTRRPWIVAMTANAMDGDREQCIEAGSRAPSSKPIRVDGADPCTAGGARGDGLIRARATYGTEGNWGGNEGNGAQPRARH